MFSCLQVEDTENPVFRFGKGLGKFTDHMLTGCIYKNKARELWEDRVKSLHEIIPQPIAQEALPYHYCRGKCGPGHYAANPLGKHAIMRNTLFAQVVQDTKIALEAVSPTLDLIVSVLLRGITKMMICSAFHVEGLETLLEALQAQVDKDVRILEYKGTGILPMPSEDASHCSFDFCFPRVGGH